MSADQSASQTNPRKPGERRAAQHATGGETRLGGRIRELTSNLVRDILDAISVASSADLGQRISAAEGAADRETQLSTTVPKRHNRERSRERGPALRSVSGTAAENAGRPAPGLPPPPNDPFDITSPSDLLASTDEPSRPAAFLRQPAEATHLGLPRPAESVTSLLDGNSDKEASSERRPRVVLREGEQLLSATGSGVVFRRERRIAPPR